MSSNKSLALAGWLLLVGAPFNVFMAYQMYGERGVENRAFLKKLAGRDRADVTTDKSMSTATSQADHR